MTRATLTRTYFNTVHLQVHTLLMALTLVVRSSQLLLALCSCIIVCVSCMFIILCSVSWHGTQSCSLSAVMYCNLSSIYEFTNKRINTQSRPVGRCKRHLWPRSACVHSLHFCYVIILYCNSYLSASSSSSIRMSFSLHYSVLNEYCLLLFNINLNGFR